MPKLKTHSGTKKRARLTKTGKLVHRHAGIAHFLQKKSSARKRRINSMHTMDGRQAKNIKRKLGA